MSSPLSPDPVPAVAASVFGDQLAMAIRYAELLSRWGIDRGLIGPREAGRIWDRHLLNSAALAGGIPAKAEVTDLGSGAGLPGIPLRLARPDLRLRLVEPMQRRVDFLREVLVDLGLDAEVVCDRAENVAPASTDIVVARALAPLARLIPWSLPLLRPDGSLLALKGRTAADELSKAGPVLRKWPTARASVGTVEYEGVTAGVVRIDLATRIERTRR